MKILFISNKYKRGEPERGPNYGYYNFYDGLLNMNNKSNQIVFFPVDEVLMEVQEDQAKMIDRLSRMISEEKPELIFFLEGELGREGLRAMRKVADENKAVTLWWVSDDSWMFDMISKKIAHYFHWVVTCDSSRPAKYKKMGYKNIIHSQYACNHFYYKVQNLPKIHDVTFVGLPHGVRRKMINGLKKEGIEVKCWGFGWPAGVLPQESLPKVFSQSKINLNFNATGGVLWKKVLSIFLKRKGERKSRRIVVDSPLNWLDNFKSFLAILRPQIHCRPFEVIGCGGFLLTDYADNFSDYYEIDKEVACFKDVKDLAEKIKYYLTHDKEREEIARSGYERTMRDHTYEKRFNDIFKIIGLAK